MMYNEAIHFFEKFKFNSEFKIFIVSTASSPRGGGGGVRLFRQIKFNYRT